MSKSRNNQFALGKVTERNTFMYVIIQTEEASQRKNILQKTSTQGIVMLRRGILYIEE